MKDIRHLTRWGFGLSFALVLALHFLKTELNPLSRHLSEYASGKYGVMMILAFLFYAFGLLGLAFQSYRSISGKKLRVAFSFLFVLSAFSAVILGLFPINVQGTAPNTSSMIHLQTAPILLVSVMVGLTFFTIRLNYEADYEKLYKNSSVLGVFAWVALILLLIFVKDTDYQGIFQRIFAFQLWIWLMYISFKMT